MKFFENFQNFLRKFWAHKICSRASCKIFPLTQISGSSASLSPHRRHTSSGALRHDLSLPPPLAPFPLGGLSGRSAEFCLAAASPAIAFPPRGGQSLRPGRACFPKVAAQSRGGNKAAAPSLPPTPLPCRWPVRQTVRPSHSVPRRPLWNSLRSDRGGSPPPPLSPPVPDAGLAFATLRPGQRRASRPLGSVRTLSLVSPSSPWASAGGLQPIAKSHPRPKTSRSGPPVHFSGRHGSFGGGPSSERLRRR